MSAGDPVVHRWAGRAMGGRASIVVVGGGSAALDRGVARLEDLEARWSRFRDDSEITALARGGRPTVVSPDTVRLVGHMASAWRTTAGRYDPTVATAVVAAGYDRTFELLGPVVASSAGMPAPGMGEVWLDRSTGLVTVPRGVGLDPGGIGKGLAADILATELVAAGAAGVLVEVGGDLRALGTGPRGGAWHVGVGSPGGGSATVAVHDAGVATSGPGHRRWRTVAGGEGHHLVDPRTALPAAHPCTVSVVAGRAWLAEALATAAALGPVDEAVALLRAHGVHGVVRAADGGDRVVVGAAA